MRKYEICMLCDRFDIGGAETHILTLSNALCDLGHHVTLLTAGGAFCQHLRKEVRVIHFPFLSPMRHPLLLPRLFRFLKKERFDVLHAHTRRTAFFCRLLSPRRTVVTAHWVFATSFPKKQLSFWGYRTLAVSEDIKGYLCRFYRLPQKQIQVTVNGIDHLQFMPAERHGVTKICLCSRLDADRADAAFALLRAAAVLSDTHVFTLTVIGDGDAMSSLRRLAAELSEKHPRFRLSLAGARTDVAPFLAECDIFVGVSRAALEAMAAGCTVVLAGNEGYLSVFDPKNAEDAERSNFCCRGARPVSEKLLTQDLKTLLNLSREDRSALGKQSRDYVLQHYSVSRMTSDALSCYASCIKRKAVLCGYYGAGNVGDELLRVAITARLKKEGYAQVLPLSRRVLSLPAMCAVLGRYDFFLGGGNLLQDATSRRSLSFYLFWLSSAQKRGCRTALISAGIGPLSEKGKERVRPFLKATDTVECRTRADLRAASSLGARQAVYRSDAVLALPLPRLCPAACRVMLAFRAPDRANADFLYTVARHMKKHFADRCFFFAMHPSDARFGKRLAKKFDLPFLSGDAGVFLGALSKCGLVVGDRLHAGICAFGMGIPFFLDGQDEKCAHFLEDVKKAAKNGGFCGDIREDAPKHIPDNADMKEARLTLVTP